MELGESILFFVLTLSLCTGVIVAHRGTKKITATYGGGLAISITYLAIVIGTSGGKHIAYSITYMSVLTPANNGEQYNQLSHSFLSNMCYFFTAFLPISLIADPSRRAARAFAPMASLASMMVLLVVLPFFNADMHAHFNAEYIFLGYKETLGVNGVEYTFYSFFYSLHLMNLLLSIGVGLTTPRHGGKGLIGIFGAYGGMYLYIGIVTTCLHLNGQNSGISGWDFDGGNFSIIGKIFNGNLAAAQVFFFCFTIIVLFLGSIIQDFVFKRKWFKFGNIKSNTGGKYGDYEHCIKENAKKDWGALGKLLTY